jgi:dTDP-4-amino-4,6-dideoxygalactose transaminase
MSMTPIKIPYEDLKLVNEKYFSELNLIADNVIKSGWYVLGRNVACFEEEFAIVNGTKFCVGVASGLDALVLGLAVFNFPRGSKVLVPSNAYIACILAVVQAGLEPVLVEPDEETCNIDILGLEKRYSRDCVAIVAVHMYGKMCPMPEIMKFAKMNGLKVVEDCAQSHFAEVNGVKAGGYGDIGAFSFYPTKNLGAFGDAGAMVTSCEDLYTRLIALRNYGSHKKYYNNYIGWNSRLDEMQASFLRLKLLDYRFVIQRKRELAKIYLEELKDISQIRLPKHEKYDHVWHIFNIRCENRDSLKRFLEMHGIGTEIHYPISPNNQKAYRGLFLNDVFPISEKIHRETLSLPISIWLEYDQQTEIIASIRKFFELGV